MQSPAKQKVLKFFLDFIGSVVPVEDARIATLGGQGLEARIWQGAGVPHDHGWLIERKKALSRELIEELPYHYTNGLETFPRVFRSVEGSDAMLDGLHLDYCGTVEPRLQEIGAVLPLIVHNIGCLAVTVSDQRRNLSLRASRTVFRSFFQKVAD